MLSQNLLNLVDTAMVGQLGAPALGAVGLGGMVNWLLSAFFVAVGNGVQAIAARRVGQGDPRGAVGALHAALLIAWAFVLPYGLLLATQTSAIFRLLSSDPAVVAQGTPYLAVRLCASAFATTNVSFRGYWNGLGMTTVYLRTILLIHAINIVLNWLLIYGNLGFPTLGVTGAGVASAIAVATGSCTYAVLAWRHARGHGFLRREQMAGAPVRAVLRLSVPPGLQMLSLAATFVMFFRIADLLGTRQLAVTNVLVNLSMICVLPAVAFGMASATLVGQALGSGAGKSAAVWGWNTLLLAVIAMGLLGFILAVAPRTWLSLLINDPQAVALGVTPLILLGLLQPADAVGVVLSRTLIGAGAVRAVSVASLLLQWGLFLPLAYGWGVRAHGGLLALWIAMGAYRLVLALVMVVLFAKGRWYEVKV